MKSSRVLFSIAKNMSTKFEGSGSKTDKNGRRSKSADIQSLWEKLTPPHPPKKRGTSLMKQSFYITCKLHY